MKEMWLLMIKNTSLTKYLALSMKKQNTLHFNSVKNIEIPV